MSDELGGFHSDAYVVEPGLTLEGKLAKLEAEVAAVKAEIRRAESDASRMPVGTVAIIGAGGGSDVETLTKQAENKWLGVYLKIVHGSTRTETIDDHTASGAIKGDKSARVVRPTP